MTKRKDVIHRSEDLPPPGEESGQDKPQPVNKPPIANENVSAEDTRKLVQELRAYQVELEMRNVELRRTQEELAASRDRYWDLYDFAPVAFFMLDEQGRIQDVNVTGTILLGVEKKHLVGAYLLRYVTPKDAEFLCSHIQHAFQERTHQICEIELVNADDVPFYACLESMTVQDSDSQVLQCRTAISDVTERKRAEEALRKSEELLRATLGSTADGILVVGNDGKVLTCNPRFVEMWHISPEVLATGEDECLLESVLDQLEDPERFKSRVLDLYRTSAKNLEEVRLKDGRVFERFTVPLVRDREEVGRVWNFRDITRRKRTEQQLEESDLKFRAITENSTDVTVLLDETRICQYASRSVTHMAAYSADEVVGRTNRDFLHPDDWSAFEASFDRALQEPGRTVRTPDFRVRHRSGKWIDSEGRLISLLHVPGVNCVVLNCRDVTDRKEAERARQVTEARYRALAENFPNGTVHLFDRELRFTLSDGALLAEIGLSKELLEGKTIHEVFSGETCVRLEPHFRAAFDGEERVFETSYAGRQFEVRTLPIRDEYGKVIAGMAMLQDITERYQAQETLVKEQNLLRAVVDNVPDPIYAKDREGRFVFVNSTVLERPYPIPVADLIGKTDFDFLSKDQADCYWAQEQDIMESGQAMINKEEHAIEITGREAWLLITKVPWRDSSGNTVGIVGVNRDVTELKRAEIALKQSEESLKALLDAIPESAILMDRRGVVLKANQAIATRLGVSMEELVGSCIYDFLAPDVAKSRRAEIEKVIHAGQPHRFLDQRNGRYIDNYVSPVLDSNHQVTHVAVLGVDVTKQKRTEEALRASEANYREIFNAMNDVILVHDIETGEILDANHKVREMWGYAPETLCHMTVGELSANEPPYTQEEAFRWIRKATEEGPQLFEWRAKTKDGRGFWLEVSLRRATVGGKDCMLAIARDISERKRTDQELARYREDLEELAEEQTRELKESQEKLRLSERLASIGTLATGIAHEINNPVGGIQLAAQNALVLTKRPEMQEVLDLCLSDIVENAKRCDRIVKSVLQFAKQERTDRWLGDLNAIVRSAALLTRKYAKEREGRTELQLADDFPQVAVNPVEIEQVFVNLIRNAFECGVRGVKVVIRTERRPKTARIVVEDNGPGMLEEQLLRVFDPFFTTRRQEGGTGLGLSIVHGIITDCGGTISVQSKLGEGTAFTIDLPWAVDSQAEVDHVKDTDR